MYKIVCRLLLYGDMKRDSVLMEMSEIFRCFDSGTYVRDELVCGIYRQIKRLLYLSTKYGFDENLWHQYLTFLLMTDENPFSLTCEKMGVRHGSVNDFARNDFKAFKELFDFDFGPIEEALDIDCFSRISNYKAIQKTERMYNKNVSDKVRALSKRLETAGDETAFFNEVTDFYKAFGVGMFGLNKAFRIASDSEGQIAFCAINNMDQVMLGDLVGYEIQKKKLIENTEAFVSGRKANNVLLFGDSGTGKSTSVKAIINAYYDRGLRMIEIYKHQFRDLSKVIAQIKNRNYYFIIYIDDLSFEEHEIEYKFLKAVIEGGVETKPENILIYATSNRRHLIRETWRDRNDLEYQQELHHSDTMEEKLSLAGRFGVQISFTKPSKMEFNHIVMELAKRAGLIMSDEQLCAEANKWEISHGGLSGRTAQQFINYLSGQENSEK